MRWPPHLQFEGGRPIPVAWSSSFGGHNFGGVGLDPSVAGSDGWWRPRKAGSGARPGSRGQFLPKKIPHKLDQRMEARDAIHHTVYQQLGHLQKARKT